MGMTDTSINAFNLKIRQTPWYQQFFAQRGLNPNQVKLNDRQREELKALVEQQTGFKLPGDMKIDPAGNLNEKGGWAGLPTGVKIAIIAGAAAATAGAAGVFGGGGGIAGSAGGSSAAASGGSTAALGAVPELGIGSLQSVLGTSGLTATGAPWAASTGGGSFLSNILKNREAVSAVGRMVGKAGDAAAENRGAQTAAMMDYEDRKRQFEQNQVLAEKNERDARADVMNNILRSDYTANWKPLDRPEGVPTQGGYNVAPETMEAAREFARQQREILNSGKYTNVNPQMTPYSEFPTQPGGFERFSNYAGPALSYYELYNTLFGKK